MTRRAPLKIVPAGVRQRRRADGTWRVWWEPSAEARARGFTAEDLTPDTLGMKRAAQLAAMVEAALAGGPAKAAGAPIGRARTVGALIAVYTADRHFLDVLKPATREDYRKAFALIARDWAETPVAALTKATIRAWREEVLAVRRPWQPKPRRPGERRAHQAKALVRKFALLLSHAELIGWIPENHNPALGLDGRRRGALLTPPRARVASWDELVALVRAARANGDRSMACAIMLAALTGQRQADIVAARVDAFADGVWTLTRSKRGNFGAIALHPVAHGAVDWWLTLRPSVDAPELLVAERTGAPYSADLFRHVWAAARATAAKAQPAVEGLQFRDLRRTFGHLARLGGALKEDVGAVIGNTAATDPQLELTYMPPADAVAARAVVAIAVPAALQKELTDE